MTNIEASCASAALRAGTWLTSAERLLHRRVFVGCEATLSIGKLPLTIAFAGGHRGPDGRLVGGRVYAFVLHSRSHDLGIFDLPLTDGVDQGSCAAPPVGSTGAIVCSIGTLASGATTTLRVIVTPTVKNNKVIEDAAIASAPSPVVDPVSINNAAAVSVQVK